MTAITTHEELMRCVEGLEFTMPGWEVHWRNDLPLGYGETNVFTRLSRSMTSWLVLICRTVDTYTYQPGDEHLGYKQIRVAHPSQVPYGIRPDYLPDWFRQQVHRAVLHEVDEWIRVNGVMQWNPHGAPVRVGPNRNETATGS